MQDGFLVQGRMRTKPPPMWSMGCDGTGEHLKVGPHRQEQAGEAALGVLSPHVPPEHAGWAASPAQVNGPIGFVC